MEHSIGKPSNEHGELDAKFVDDRSRKEVRNGENGINNGQTKGIYYKIIVVLFTCYIQHE